MKWNPSTGLLRAEVYERILSELEQGKIVPGQTFSLGKLAEDMRVSKTPLRDALLGLQAEGFVTLYPQRGVMVNELSQNDKVELYEVCGQLESKAIHSLFSRVTPKHIQRLRDINARMSPDKEISSTAYNRLNMDFHNVYMDLETNTHLKKILHTDRLLLFQFAFRDWGAEFQRNNYEEHNRIISLFESGTVDELASYIVQEHWSISWIKQAVANSKI